MSIDDNVSMFYGAKAHIFEKAKALRQNMTSSELKLWEYLKGKYCWDCDVVHNILWIYLLLTFIVIRLN